MGQIVAFDSNVFIYWLDKGSPFFSKSDRTLRLLEDDNTTGVISVLVATELRAGMKGMKDMAVLDAFAQKLLIIPMDRLIADRAGMLRQEFPALRTPDAIHIATAIESGASRFYTNDNGILRLGIKGLTVLPLVVSH